MTSNDEMKKAERHVGEFGSKREVAPARFTWAETKQWTDDGRHVLNAVSANYTAEIWRGEQGVHWGVTSLRSTIGIDAGTCDTEDEAMAEVEKAVVEYESGPHTEWTRVGAGRWEAAGREFSLVVEKIKGRFCWTVVNMDTGICVAHDATDLSVDYALEMALKHVPGTEIDAGFEIVPNGEWEVRREVFSSRYGGQWSKVVPNGERKARRDVFSSRYGGMWSKVIHEHKQGTVEWFVQETQYGAPFATNTACSVLGAKLAAERAVNNRNKEHSRKIAEDLFGELAKEALIDLARWEAGLGKEALDCWDDLTGKSAETEQAERARQVTKDLNEAFTDFNKAIDQYLDDVKTMNDAARAEAAILKGAEER